MKMVYVKVWLDWHEITRKLKDAEKGRLIDAIVAYAKGDDPEAYITGNEQFVFPYYQQKVDQDRAELDDLTRVRSEAGQKGGRPKKANASDENQKNQMLSEESKKSKAYSIKHIAHSTEPKAYTGDIPPVSPPGQAFTYSEEFERFWAAYPKKVSKGDAYKAFNRITGVPLSVMLYAIDEQRHTRQWTEDNGRYIPNPATWLNRRNWENGPTETEPQSGGNPFADIARELEQEEQQHEPH